MLNLHTVKGHWTFQKVGKMMVRPWEGLFAMILLTCIGVPGAGQSPVFIQDSVDQHIFSFSEIEYLEDPQRGFTIEEVSSPAMTGNFKTSASFSPENVNKSSAYWCRIKIKHNAQSGKQWLIEFFDQTIDRIDFFIPDSTGKFMEQSYGDSFEFNHRPLKHKNFVVLLAYQGDHEITYYFRVKSNQQANILVVLRAREYFFHYAIDEYFFFGIFYGMILVFCLYNLLMYIAVRERHYLYYILYLMAIGLYEMSADGVAFQYLWPRAVEWNQRAVGFTLYFASTFALLFTASLLNLRKRHPKLLRLLVGIFIFRTLFLWMSVFFVKEWFTFRFVEIVPFVAAFYTTVYCLLKGYRPARLLVVAYSFLFFGILVKISLYFDVDWMPFGSMTHYTLGFCFIMQMMFLSFAIRDKIKLLRVQKEQAQQRTIEQLRVNQGLKDSLNEELEERVRRKTKQLLSKSELIQQQNFHLEEANHRLAEQAGEIAAMNALLARDNILLKQNVVKVTEARILSKEVDFEEFSAQYPDDIHCLKFLADLKWGEHDTCRRCGHDHYSSGRSPWSRRCSKCGYDESAIAFTILQNTRIPVTKAFYMIFLVYSSKGSISSHKLSEILDIRQGTCWAYNTKIKKAMREKKKSETHKEDGGWKSILLEKRLHQEIS
jgi:hypothetical protein